MLKFLAIALTAFSVHAEPAYPASGLDLYKLFPVLQCPSIGDEYEALVEALTAIKASVKDGANCNQVNQKVKSLEQLITTDREAVLNIVNNLNGTNLTADQAAIVRKYAEDVTKKVTSLQDLFLKTNACFKDDQAVSKLESLSGFVNEAAQLISHLSGPWGTPIAIAGNVVAGFLTGMNEVLKSRAGYDFSKREQWTNYVQNLCTFHALKEHIDHLLNPEDHMARLRILQARVNAQIGSLNGRQNEGAQPPPPEQQQSPDHSQITALKGFYLLQALGVKEWVKNEIDRVKKESQTFWSGVSGRHVLGQAEEEIEQFLIYREGPRFLKNQIDQTHADFVSFVEYSKTEGLPLYLRLEKASRSSLNRILNYIFWVNPLDVFETLVIEPVHWEKLTDSSDASSLKFQWNSFKSASLNRLHLTEASLNVHTAFCSFFKNSGRYDSNLRQTCESAQAVQLAETLHNLNQQLVKAQVEMAPKKPLSTEGTQYSQSKLEAITRTMTYRMSEP